MRVSTASPAAKLRAWLRHRRAVKKSAASGRGRRNRPMPLTLLRLAPETAAAQPGRPQKKQKTMVCPTGRAIAPSEEVVAMLSCSTASI